MAHEVGRPTYEVVGTLLRVDERDTVFARESLIPGSVPEREYHRLHPELAEVDRRLTRFIQDRKNPGEDHRPLQG